MPTEEIGGLSTGEMPVDAEWVVCAYEMAIRYLEHVVRPPPHYQLEVLWNVHELGSYPSLGVVWEEPYPWPSGYFQRWEQALRVFDEAIQWSNIEPTSIHQKFVAEFGDELVEDEEEAEEGTWDERDVEDGDDD